jgi:integrase
MIPTFRPVVYAHHKRKDGTYNVKINVYFKGKERRLPTTIFCTKADITRSCHIKNNDILILANREIDKMRAAIADISFFDLETKDVDWLVSKIKAKLQAQSFNLDFFTFADKFLEGVDKPSTLRNYRSALNAFARFLGSRYIDINDITKKKVMEFYAHVDNQRKSYYSIKEGRQIETDKKVKKGYASLHIGRLSTIFNAAKKKYNDDDEGLILIPRSPFEGLELAPLVHEGQKPLSQELMQKIILAEVPSRCFGQRTALDVLVVSFALMGANVADLLEARNPVDGVWEYERKKTRDRRIDRARMRVLVPDVIRPYLERLGAGTGEYWLPALHEVSRTERKITTQLNARIKVWCENEGIEPFTFYAVRKTWATLARKQADKSIVDEGLAHKGGYDLTDIYADRPWEKINKANADVLALFEWPQ